MRVVECDLRPMNAKNCESEIQSKRVHEQKSGIGYKLQVEGTQQSKDAHRDRTNRHRSVHGS
jgi:hypothetical protein